MSTKVTIAYASPSTHKEDFHLYFDYADYRVHLEIDGREIPLPSRLQAWIYNVWSVLESLDNIRLFLNKPDMLYIPPLGAISDCNRESRDLHDPLADVDIPEVEW